MTKKQNEKICFKINWSLNSNNPVHFKVCKRISTSFLMPINLYINIHFVLTPYQPYCSDGEKCVSAASYSVNSNK